MKPIPGFDLLNAPLSGTNLTEASAGTGKTYTITGLFLRLILEKRLPVNRILVVTFTEAATQELQDRIRSALRHALAAFSGETVEDSFLADLAEKHRNTRTALGDIEEALRAFDQAAIFTIHGFCRRMLHDNAFESGSLFDTELISDQGEITRQIVRDYWRKHFYDASPLFVHYAISRRVSLESLLLLLGNRISLPYLKVVPECDLPDTSVEEQSFLTSFASVRDAWESDSGPVEDIFSNDESLNRVKFNKRKVSEWIKGMDDYLATDGHNPLLFMGFEKFTKTALEQGVKKGHRPPEHRFFDQCERLKARQTTLMAVFHRRLLALKTGLYHYARKELARRKTEKNIQSFDDLLFRLHEALNKKGGDALARAIGAKFKAALIDEFQDTDPIQYDIFKRVFGTEKSILFLIGDPKQAIYGFRSADVFTYMEAAENVTTRYSLGRNWRSEPDLIAAVNTLFDRAHHPFVYDQIPFYPARAARDENSEILEIDGHADAPFHLWFVNAQKVTGRDKPIPKTQARKLIAEAVAGEISRLLRFGKDNRALLGQRPLSAEDIAVLVRRNADARLMKRVLSELNIPSVLHSTGNLFDTYEAQEMERLLASLVEPSHEGLLKTALATDMMGIKAQELEALIQDEIRWEARVVRFKEYHDLWQKKGFVQMFRRLLFAENVIVRLMALSDGERRNTNVLHLCEVLHQASVEKKLGMAGLVKWLAGQRDPNSPRLEEHQLRLESDERSVKLVTVHKSKGLEYPVVFCPFVWDGTSIPDAKEAFTFHDRADHMRLTLEMGSENRDRNRDWAEQEALAEQLRLLYVAVTRARNRCNLVWGRFNQAETSAPAYLFHQPMSREDEDLAGTAAERFAGLSDEQILDDLKDLAAMSKGTVAVSEMPSRSSDALGSSAVASEALTHRIFSRRINRYWQIASFSSLTYRGHEYTDWVNYDSGLPSKAYGKTAAETSGVEEEAEGIFAFPKGTKAGTFVHSIFEELDFTEKDPAHMEGLVADKLAEFGYGAEWQRCICDMIGKVLSASFDSGYGEFALNRLARKDRLTELGFYFPLRSVSADSLKTLLAKHPGLSPDTDSREHIGRLDFSPVKGFMRGFIDMVFQFEKRYYLVDWKTNFLGPTVEDYGQEALSAAMSKGFYVLQYLLYTVALHEYLQLRLPEYSYEKHFGGVFYLFVRGVDPKKGLNYGIFRDRPPEALIDELSERLIDRVGQARGNRGASNEPEIARIGVL
jgi:exodeoxyribonuclease V beta subunit